MNSAELVRQLMEMAGVNDRELAKRLKLLTLNPIHEMLDPSRPTDLADISRVAEACNLEVRLEVVSKRAPEPAKRGRKPKEQGNA